MASDAVQEEGDNKMQKIICMKKVLLFLGGLICVFSLSGCSTVVKSMMDGDDSVLNGLADGANRVMEGFADGANQTLDSLSEADEGQLKDHVLETYGAFVDEIGAAALTPEGKLKGTLSKGTDNYTGSYEAIYSDFTGTELVFGGTTLRREEGNTLKIECLLSLENGDAAIFLLSGSDDPVTLLSATGKYTGTVKVDGESTYIGVRGRNADGTVSLKVT